MYPRVCHAGQYHYETIQINLQQNGLYTFDTNSTTIELFGYIYEYDFDPLYPNRNLIAQSSLNCSEYRFIMGISLQADRTYILVITTLEPNIQGSFLISIIGPHNITLTKIS